MLWYTGVNCATNWRSYCACMLGLRFRSRHVSLQRTTTQGGAMAYDLEFEKPLAELEKRIVSLQRKGDRKAGRVMEQAEKFGIPVVCLIDTPGAFLALGDEERGQSEAIAANLYRMARLRVPIISVVIGEGGSGGALAISVADRILMLENSIYTVAMPEASASILWRDKVFAPQAAEAMRISAKELKAIDLIDELIPEPLGGAHHNYSLTADNLKTALLDRKSVV